MAKLNKLGVKNSLWNNIRANKGSGKEPTKEMLEQEAKIKAKYAIGGKINQAQQLNAGKMRMGNGEGNDILDYAEDYGKFLLDAGSAPLEGLTGAKIYNPTYDTKIGTMAGKVGNTVGGTVGKMLPQVLNMVAPGVGTAVGAAGQGVGSIINSTGQQEMEQMGAKMSYKQGGLMHINEGGTHEQNALGGVPIGPNALVEQGETINNNFVFSDRLKPKGSKKTYAQLSKSVDTKYRLRPDDKLSKEAKQMDLDRLAMQQEAQKDEMSTKYIQKAMSYGGKMNFGGQIMGPISQSMNVTNGQNTLLANGGLMSNFMEPEPVYQNPANQYTDGGPIDPTLYFDENLNPVMDEDYNYNFMEQQPKSMLAADINPLGTPIQTNYINELAPISNKNRVGNTPELPNYNESNYQGNKQNPESKLADTNPSFENKVGNIGYLSNLAGNLAKTAMVATSKPPIYNPSLKFNRLNSNPAERLAMQEGRREIQGTKDIIRNNATSSGQYLTNASLMGSSAANKLAGTIGGIRQQYDTQNVGIGNQEAQLNQQITAGNNLAKEQFRDNRLNQYNKILDSVIGANQQRFATDVHANNYQNQAIALLKTKDYHIGRKDKNGMFEILDINGNMVGTLDQFGKTKDLLGNPIK